MRRRCSGDDGTSSLELVGVLPVIAVVLLALIQGGVAAYAVSATQNAARNAARESARSNDPQLAAERSMPGWLDPDVLSGPAGVAEVVVDVPDVLPGVDLVVRRRAQFPVTDLPVLP